jgi:agmatine/peptidylarginine deiminase
MSGIPSQNELDWRYSFHGDAHGYGNARGHAGRIAVERHLIRPIALHEGAHQIVAGQDLARFVAPDTIVTVVEEDAWDENYEPLQKNLQMLNRCRLANGKQPTIVELPMPDVVFYDGQRLPASYANFYIANGKVIFPTYRCLTDNEAAYILEACFPDREVVGIDSTDIIWGLGSFHCLSQQMPAV